MAVTIETNTSIISDQAGNGVSGKVTVASIEEFEYDDTTNVFKVTTVPNEHPFTDGLLDATFDLIPNHGTGVDKYDADADTGPCYIADFLIDSGESWREFWIIRVAQDNTTIEITEIELKETTVSGDCPDDNQLDQHLQDSDPHPQYVLDDDTSVVPAADKIPKADGSGKLDDGWLDYDAGDVPIDDSNFNTISGTTAQAAIDSCDDEITTNASGITQNATDNAGTVTIHSDVSDAGSGQIITAGERTQIGTNQSDITDLQNDKVDKSGDAMTGELVMDDVASEAITLRNSVGGDSIIGWDATDGPPGSSDADVGYIRSNPTNEMRMANKTVGHPNGTGVFLRLDDNGRAYLTSDGEDGELLTMYSEFPPATIPSFLDLGTGTQLLFSLLNLNEGTYLLRGTYAISHDANPAAAGSIYATSVGGGIGGLLPNLLANNNIYHFTVDNATENLTIPFAFRFTATGNSDSDIDITLENTSGTIAMRGGFYTLERYHE